MSTNIHSLARRLLPLAGLIVLIVIFAIESPRGKTGENLFLSPDNFFNIARQQSAILLIAFGMTLVIISGGIDLSVGSVSAFCGVMAAIFMLPPSLDPTKMGGLNCSVAVGMLGGVIFGALWGAANALLISVLRLPPFIATLGSMGIARGLAYILSHGQSVDVTAEGIGWSDLNLLGLPVPLWIILVAGLLCYFILSQTVIGRTIFAVGGNPQAARFAGIDQRRTLFFVYTLCGALTGVASMIDVSRGVSAQPNGGQGAELNAIAAVVIGGGSLLGGIGTIAGTLIGALVIAVLRNGANLLSVDPFLQQIIVGALIIAAVAFDQWRQK